LLTANSDEQKWALTDDQREHYRQMMLEDPWLFVCHVCEHGEQAVERFHRPLIYLLTGKAQLLAACLNQPQYDSELTKQVRGECHRRGIDWNTPEGFQRFSILLNRINVRISRSMGKTTMGLDALLYLATEDPNITIGIASKSDPAAQDMCETIGRIMRSPMYQFFFGDRIVPKNTDQYITRSAIWVNGRTVNDKEWTIEARGINAQWTSRHYNIRYRDDTVGTESGEASIEDALKFEQALDGISKPQWALNRNISVGTRYGDNDDCALLEKDINTITVQIPIETHDFEIDLSNILTPGKPVLPEWYSPEWIHDLKVKLLADPIHGVPSLLQNFFLIPHKEGLSLFTKAAVYNNDFQWVKNPANESRPLVSRIRKFKDRDGKEKEERIVRDPYLLPRAIGSDLAASVSGDNWAIAVGAIDDYGFIYVLEVQAGKGYSNWLTAIEYIDLKWNKPQRVGTENGTLQIVTEDFMKRDARLRNIQGRMQKVPHNNQSKVRRINALFASRLITHELGLNPLDLATKAECLRWRAKDTDEDDRLDAISMLISVMYAPASNRDHKLRERQLTQLYDKQYDTSTGVNIGFNWMEN
jgi:hypothetical protein